MRTQRLLKSKKANFLEKFHLLAFRVNISSNKPQHRAGKVISVWSLVFIHFVENERETYSDEKKSSWLTRALTKVSLHALDTAIRFASPSYNKIL